MEIWERAAFLLKYGTDLYDRLMTAESVLGEFKLLSVAQAHDLDPKKLFFIFQKYWRLYQQVGRFEKYLPASFFKIYEILKEERKIKEWSPRKNRAMKKKQRLENARINRGQNKSKNR